MVHYDIFTTYTLPFDEKEYYVTTISARYFHEVGSIPCRRKWCRDDSG
jgi:hypothetical protein